MEKASPQDDDDGLLSRVAPALPSDDDPKPRAMPGWLTNNGMLKSTGVSLILFFLVLSAVNLPAGAPSTVAQIYTFASARPVLRPFVESSSQSILAPSSDSEFETWLRLQREYSFRGVLENIGPNGTKVQGASPGIVVASPSKKNPDYFFTWTRDSSLTMKCVIDEFIWRTRHDKNFDSANLQELIHLYINAQGDLQTVPNPSGDLYSGGLGEPKFHVDKTAFTEVWGRPQRDGPALRAIALTEYAKWLLANGAYDVVKAVLWPIIRNDLTYVSRHWNETGFDLWEEVRGSSFFTTAVQYRALVEGNIIANDLGLTYPESVSQAAQILCFLQSYWTGSHINANQNTGPSYSRTGLDVSSVLASIYLFDKRDGCDDLTFQPCSSRALRNHKVLVDSFRGIYDISHAYPALRAVPIGRYREDVYMGGNPWYLALSSMAELLYDALYQWERLQYIHIDGVSLPFFKDIYPSAEEGHYSSRSSEYRSIARAVRNYADEFLTIIRNYTPESRALYEQFSRKDGRPTSVFDLTWSYSAFTNAYARRHGVVPSSWGASTGSLSSLPSNCKSTSATGPYCQPSSRIHVENGSLVIMAEKQGGCATLPPVVNVTLSVRTTAAAFASGEAEVEAERVYCFVGSSRELGCWEPRHAIPMDKDGETRADGSTRWTTSINLASGEMFEYKYLRKSNSSGGDADDENVVWEKGHNRYLCVPAKCGVRSTTVDAVWR